MTNSLDNLLAPTLRKSIEINLGKSTLNKIEQRLMERHGLGLVQAIKDFHKFDGVLREFFGAGADGLETKFLQNIIDLKQQKKAIDNWIIIKDQELAKVFLESFADEDKKAIIGSVLDTSLIIADILSVCNVPQTSGYRKINQLIDSGLLISNGYEIASDGKKIKKYESIFDNVKMDIEKNVVVVKVQLKKTSIQESVVLQVISN
ncbi:transcriptional regulator [Nitrosarchaeum sp. AC2]|uniref:transcriptional regulator n=1 Tax=Nitrosarchaeum sp. AC2 TaxID=2259673 RepID=UPI0015DBCE7D|nr:transcriptional regulator [Nitrosarchaeum sp. AC2]QLH10705.1 transcriptional regulator [Nitrosarchaeum sp. AC2]